MLLITSLILDFVKDFFVKDRMSIALSMRAEEAEDDSDFIGFFSTYRRPCICFTGRPGIKIPLEATSQLTLVEWSSLDSCPLHTASGFARTIELTKRMNQCVFIVLPQRLTRLLSG